MYPFPSYEPDELPVPFHVYQPALLPPLLQEMNAARWSTALGLTKDAVATAVTRASLAHMVKYAPADALPLHGWERRIDRGPGETDESYRNRLSRAFTLHRLGDSDLGVVTAFAALGLTVRIRRNNQWNYDGHPGNVVGYWARMWIVIDPPHPLGLPAQWGGGFRWGGGTPWGVSGPAPLIALITRLATKWTGSHVQVVKILVRLNGFAWGDGLAWGGGTAWGAQTAFLDAQE